MELARFKQERIPEILGWITNESEMVQWAGPLFSWPLTRKQFLKHLESAKIEPPTLYPFGLYNDGALMGYGELWGHHRHFKSAIASRIIISPQRRNRGLGQLIVGRLLKFGFEELGLNRIGLGVFDFNEAAIKCYKKARFILEGTMRESAKAEDAYWNCHIMSILRKEWEGLC